MKPLPRWADLILLPFINLCTAFFVCGIVVYIIGENPWEALLVMLKGAFIYPGSLGYTLYYTTNFIFTGLAVATAFHAKLFNIGGEGQAYVGSLGILLATALFAPFLPAVFVVLLCIICSAMVGAAWAFIPGYLQAKRGSHVVITTIMFNFLASSLMVYLLAGPLIQLGQQSPQSDLIPESAQLASFETFLGLFGVDIASSPLNLSFVLALLALFVFWVLIWKTRLGYEIRAVGKNQDAANYAGINVPKIIIITMTISGAFAGLLAVNEVMGVQHRAIPESAQLASFETFLGLFGVDIASSPLNLSFVLALLALFVFWVLIWKTRLGYEIRAVGKNQDAANYAGINVPKIIIITMTISGAFAGLLAVNEVMGVQHRAILNFTAGYGFTGIAVALMGRNHPVGIFFASLLFGALFQGGAELDFEFQSITRDMVLLIQGMIILFSGALAYMFNPALSKVFSRITKNGANDD